jgi:hypothetical protein
MSNVQRLFRTVSARIDGSWLEDRKAHPLTQVVLTNAEKAFGIFAELMKTMQAAKVVSLTLVLE